MSAKLQKNRNLQQLYSIAKDKCPRMQCNKIAKVTRRRQPILAIKILKAAGYIFLPMLRDFMV